MDAVNVIVQIFQNLGVPVACLVACFWYIWKRDEDWKLREANYQEMVNNLSEVISNNTLALQRLMDKIGGER